MSIYNCVRCGIALHGGSLCRLCEDREACVVDKRKDRRERIATAAMQGLLAAFPNQAISPSVTAVNALVLADALIKELDK